MKKILFSILLLSSICTPSFPVLNAEANDNSAPRTRSSAPVPLVDAGIVLFTPPPGWRLADSNLLPERVKIMVVGKGPSPFPPSMNLSLEPYKGSLKQYLKIVKNMNEAQGYEWKDLGTIRTEAGNASLSQVDTKTEWGPVRLMHVILLKNETIYILTASALKDEFSQFYKDFFAAMRSLRVSKDAFEMVINPQQRSQLKNSVQKLQTEWQTVITQKHKENSAVPLDHLKEQTFKGEPFQTLMWQPFKEMLAQKFMDMGLEWQSLVLQKVEDDLFEINLNQ